MASRIEIQQALARARAANDAEAVADLESMLVEAQPLDFSAGEMIRNIPGSAVQLGKDLATPFLSPVQTTKGLWRTMTGAAQLAVPGEQGNEPYARAVGQGLKDRYGGAENLKLTLQQDPVGLLSDVAGLATGGASTAAKLSGRVGGMANKAARLADPVNLVKAGAGTLIPARVPRTMTESALKLSTAADAAKRRQITETVLDERVLPNQKGLNTLVDRQRATWDQIDQLIKAASASGRTVPLSVLTQTLGAVRDRFGGPRLTAGKDVAAIDKLEQDWLDSMAAQGRTQLTIQDLQDFKQGAYQQVDYDRRNQAGTLPVEEATKAMATRARQEIENQVPAVAPLNQRYGELAEAIPAVERSANRIANRDLLGIGAPIKGGAGAALGGAPGALAGVASGFFDAPMIKARTALMLEALRRQGLFAGKKYQAPTDRGVLTRFGLAQSGRLEDDPDRNSYAYY